ncbi:uncharacterized protein LOC115219780 [Argonauta hians]
MTSYTKLNTSIQRSRCLCCTSKRRCISLLGRCFCISVITFTLVLTTALLYIYATYPPHASCSIKWTFNTSCSTVNSKLVNQIGLWNSSSCGDGMKCLYKLESHNSSLILGTHFTPTFYADSFYFSFDSDNTTCYVEGVSSSDVWYALLDFSVNYCNLHNLITGSGLDRVSGYTEFTDNSVCTLYTSRNCEKY